MPIRYDTHIFACVIIFLAATKAKEVSSTQDEFQPSLAFPITLDFNDDVLNETISSKRPTTRATQRPPESSTFMSPDVSRREIEFMGAGELGSFVGLELSTEAGASSTRNYLNFPGEGSSTKRILYDPIRPTVDVTSADHQHDQQASNHGSARYKRAVEGHHSLKKDQNGKMMTRHCGGTFTELGGLILSPNYPLYYPNMHDCLYVIMLPPGDHGNLTVKFTCDDFRLQGTKDGPCEDDFLEVLDSSGNSTERHCGEYTADSPLVINSDSNVLKIRFMSDNLFRYRGFKCRYRAMHPNGVAVINSYLAGEETNGNRVHRRYDKNFFKSLNHCAAEGQDDHQGGENPEHATIDPQFTSGGGLWSGNCGTANEQYSNGPTNRIVGGYETVPHQYPWMVSVLKDCTPENETERSWCHICGGTLISEDWVLTGAHCMQKVPMERIQVLLGAHNLNSDDKDMRFVSIIRKVIHPDYNTPTILNADIGILKLKDRISSFTKYVNPLCLPPIGETGFGTSAYGPGNHSVLDTAGLDIVGKKAIVLGWGIYDEHGNYPDGLQQVEVEILDNSVCAQLYGPIINQNMMCTKGENKKGSCTGDSGGPAIVKTPEGNYVQVGIVSFGASTGCHHGYPSGQVMVHKFSDWIKMITNLKL